jgi:flagellar basal-body rod protein FlgB
MSFNLDKALGVPAAALQLRAQRTKVIAENLANADTPNFKARDIDFQTAMKQAQGQQSLLRTTQASHIQPPGSAPLNPALQYRIPFSPALDGNTVETQAEQAKFAENTVNYQATLTLLGARIQGLLGALRGE